MSLYNRCWYLSEPPKSASEASPVIGRVSAGVLVAALATTVASAQDYANVRTFLENSTEFKTAYPIVQQVAKANGTARFNWSIIDTGQTPEHLGRPVWIHASVIRALKAEPGQLAFAIAHGIARNDIPSKIEQRNLVCTDTPSQTLGALRNPSDYVIKSRAECESMADPIAVRYLARAGYNPLDASAFLARVTSARLNEDGREFFLQTPWVRDYADMFAVDRQRLDRLRQFVNEFCKDPQARCQ